MGERGGGGKIYCMGEAYFSPGPFPCGVNGPSPNFSQTYLTRKNCFIIVKLPFGSRFAHSLQTNSICSLFSLWDFFSAGVYFWILMEKQLITMKGGGRAMGRSLGERAFVEGKREEFEDGEPGYEERRLTFENSPQPWLRFSPLLTAFVLLFVCVLCPLSLSF